jgi:hypothetical protein
MDKAELASHFRDLSIAHTHTTAESGTEQPSPAAVALAQDQAQYQAQHQAQWSEVGDIRQCVQGAVSRAAHDAQTWISAKNTMVRQEVLYILN